MPDIATIPSKEHLKKVHISFHEEDAKYEGKPLIEPKIPYQYEHKYRKVDKSLPFLRRAGTKIRYMSEDFVEYLKDIVFLRQERFAFKTADFVKRNKHWIGHQLHHVWDELKKLGQGFRKFKEDIKYYFRYKKE